MLVEQFYYFVCTIIDFISQCTLISFRKEIFQTVLLNMWLESVTFINIILTYNNTNLFTMFILKDEMAPDKQIS